MPRPLSEFEIADFREKLAEAAEALVERLGLADFTIRQLADEMDVSPMTPYRYVKDKDEILAIMRTRAFEKFSNALEAAFEVPGNAVEKCNAVGEAYIRFALDDPTTYKLMFEVAQEEGRYPALTAAAKRARETMTRHVYPLIEQGILEGDPEIIGYVFWATLHGALMLQLAGKIERTVDLRKILDAAFGALNAGFAPRPGSNVS